VQSSHFCDGGQHDAQELVRVLLDVLNDAHNRVQQKPAYQEDPDDDAESPRAKADRTWASTLAREASPITDAFLGQLQSRVVCHECSNPCYTYEPFMDLSLSLTREGTASLLLAEQGYGIAVATCY
jgi:ubiquitin C-terminal hydrolase